MKELKKIIKTTGTVIPGKKLGQKIGFPTVNLELAEKLKIKPGVYASICYFKEKSFLGLAYFGPKYVQGQSQNSFEVFLFNFNQNIYGQKLNLKLTHFIRPPKKFNSISQLQIQLKKDVQAISQDQLILVNKKDQITGFKKILTAHQNPPQLHRAISIVVFNSKKEILLQKRSQHKLLWPLFWSNACCTHPRPAESIYQAAERRLDEEMGLKVKLKFLYKFIYKAKYNSKLSENEVDAVFIGISDQKPQLNSKEAADYQYMSFSQLKKDIKINPQKYTPWFKLILKKLKSSDILTS